MKKTKEERKQEAYRKYEAIQEPALKKYEAIIKPAYKEYENRCEEIDNEI